MVKVTILSPTKAFLSFASQEEENSAFQLGKYTNTSAQFQLKRHLKNERWRSHDPVGFGVQTGILKEKANRSVLWKEQGALYTRPGYLPYLAEHFELSIENKIKYPEPKPFPWYRKPAFTPYPYQTASVEKLIEAKHANVSICTGGGKSLIIMMLAQKMGLKTLVVAPSRSIFGEMIERFEYHFGKGTIGAVGAGKKVFNKKITICISDSLVNLKPGTKEYDEIASADVLIADESHTIPAETLEKVCHGLLKDIPYRFFLSGTQTRGDGTEKLLHSIIGPTVHSLTTKEAIRDGYICNHKFKIVPVETTNPGFTSDDALAMKRKHLLNNGHIANFVAKLSHAVAETRNEKTLVLIDELSQFVMLYPLLKTSFVLATSAEDKFSILSVIAKVPAAKLKKMAKSNPEIYDQLFSSLSPDQKKMMEIIKNSDPDKAVENFNAGNANILVGTSCIATGTNIYPTHHTINWQGGTSEIKTKQGAIGRSVRKLTEEHLSTHPPKEFSIIYDFHVVNIPSMERHLKTRLRYYKESGTSLEWIGGVDLTK